MEGDESRRISELEWRLAAAEQSVKLANERIKALEEAQQRAEQMISNLTAVVESVTSGRPMSSGGD